MKHLLTLVLIFLMGLSKGQHLISKKDSKELPVDLKTETILFLKFDSVALPANKPRGVEKSNYVTWQKFNEMVPSLNKQLRESAAKYPYKYKIISMREWDYSVQGVKYLFWMNSFKYYRREDLLVYRRKPGYGEPGEAALGIVDLWNNKNYLISWSGSINNTLRYKELIGMLNKEIQKQFK